MAGFENGFQEMQDKIAAQLVATTRTAGQLAAEDIGFLSSSDPKAKRKLEKQNRHLLELAQRLIGSATADASGPVPDLKRPADIDENWRSVVDVIDGLLERADRSFDEFHGIIRKAGGDKEEAAVAGRPGGKENKLRDARSWTKPQLSFKRVPKNDETTAFRPLLTSKPHALVPLEECLRPVAGKSGFEEYKHPYETEITQSTFPPSAYIKSEPVPPIDDPDGKTLTWVDSIEQVQAMLEELKQAEEIAIDLEHHDMHSYVGLVCLMQISTREKDWIVDTLKPWREDLQLLNEVFADANILKVFHGSHSDMIWLQRDLGLYIVGLFDTYHAATALAYPKRSLAYLLKRFENFDADKKYQMADWRTRPLSKEMMQYARSDTHYLLHVYDCMRNELIDASTAEADGNTIDYVLERSKEEALQRYERSFYDFEHGNGPMGWLTALAKTSVSFTKEQLSVFRAVHQFRDKIARQSDEGLFTVMRHDTIISIARDTPEDMAGLLRCISPVSQFLRPKLTDLVRIIKQAKQDGESMPELSKLKETYSTQKHQQRVELRQQKNGKDTQPAPVLSTGVAEVLERVKAFTPISQASMFWGSSLAVNEEAKRPSSNSLADMGGLRLSLPVPASSAIDAPTVSRIPDGPALESLQATNPDADQQIEAQTFTIKDLRKAGVKRKAGDGIDTRPTKQQSQEREDEMDVSPVENQHDAGGPSNADTGFESLYPAGSALQGEKQLSKRDLRAAALAGTLTPPNSEEQATLKRLNALSKKDRKAELRTDPALRYAYQRASEYNKVHGRSGNDEDDGEPSADAEEEEAPFDYAAAPSVLQAGEQSALGNGDRRKGKKGKGGKEGEKKEFDPYAKALDTAKGLPKPRQGGAGRSKTFTS